MKDVDIHVLLLIMIMLFTELFTLLLISGLVLVRSGSWGTTFVIPAASCLQARCPRL